jgi:hypothetical protein
VPSALLRLTGKAVIYGSIPCWEPITIAYTFDKDRCTRFCQPRYKIKLATTVGTSDQGEPDLKPASMDMDGTRKGGNRIPTVYLLEPSISSTSPSYLEPHKTPTVPDTHIPVITVPIPPLPMMQQRQSRAFSCWVSYTYMRMGPSKRPAGRLLTRVEEQSRAEQNANRRP